jgi:hypothetical protein
MKMLALCIAFVALCADAYSTSFEKLATSHRSVLGSAIAAITALTFGFTTTVATADDKMNVYFGVGCSWHIQYEFIEAEQKILGQGVVCVITTFKALLIMESWDMGKWSECPRKANWRVCQGLF